MASPAEHAKTWRQRHPERAKEVQTRWRAANREQVRRTRIEWQYGLTPERYAEILARQGGRCAICGTDNPGRWFDVDHDHACCPGQRSCGQCVRGLLCHGCNKGIGQFDDNPDLLLAAVMYLRPEVEQ